MDGFRQFFEDEAHSQEMRDRIRRMFLNGDSRRDIFMQTGVHNSIIDKIIHDFKAAKEVQIASNAPKSRMGHDGEERVKALSAQGQTPYQIYKATGISYIKINKILGLEGTGAPRKLTDEQKAKIVSAAVQFYYGDSEIARMLGIQNRAQIVKIIAPYLTPEIIAKRKQRLIDLYKNKEEPPIPFDQIPPFPGYKNPDKYIRPISPTPIPGTRIQPRPRNIITAQGRRPVHDFPKTPQVGNDYKMNSLF